MMPEIKKNFSQKTRILTSNISVWDLNETVECLHELCQNASKHYVCVSNVHTVVLGMQDPSFGRITNQATLATADGMPLVWASHVNGGPQIHGRASGPDILEKILINPRYQNLKHFFYGSTPQVLKKLEEKLRNLAPHGKYVGFHSPPFRPLRPAEESLSEEEAKDCLLIDAAKPDIVWVGLGAPKQEVWMYRVREHIRTASVLIGVGAAFDFLAQTKARAPLYMQRAGLEWLHRLSQEPKRLTSRYLKTNPQFIAALCKQILFKNAFKQKE